MTKEIAKANEIDLVRETSLFEISSSKCMEWGWMQQTLTQQSSSNTIFIS